jgi:hypothetical protein
VSIKHAPTNSIVNDIQASNKLGKIISSIPDRANTVILPMVFTAVFAFARCLSIPFLLLFIVTGDFAYCVKRETPTSDSRRSTSNMGYATVDA